MKQAGPLWLTSAEAIKLVTESEWQGVLVGLFRAHGWLVYHTKFSIKSDPGFPDLCCVHPKQKRQAWIEVKREDGKPSAPQVVWLDALRDSGAEVYLLKPSHWDSAVAIAQARPE